MHVEIGNFYYFLYFVFAFLITIGLILFLKNKDDRYKEKVITILLFSAFFLHFIKLLFYPYNDLYPDSIRKVTFENICFFSNFFWRCFFMFNQI